MEKQAIITRIFLGNGGGVHSRIWCRVKSGEFNFDVIGLEEARKYQRGQTITIRIVDGRAYPAPEAAYAFPLTDTYPDRHALVDGNNTILDTIQPKLP